jgi:serine/threonine protein kinase
VEHTKAERKILQALQHPFLMTLRYAFQSKDKLYFVLDYYQGGELFFHLKTARRFPEDVARVWVGEVALALGHLHSLSVIYRDLKPENILLDDNGHCCLTDFGLSKDVDPNDKAHTFCGTPEYLAPEIVTGAGHDKAVDWWSLGILLYELTVGIPPFYSQNVNEMYNKIQHGVLRFPPFLSEPCKAMIVALLNRDPKKRLGSKADIDDLKQHAFFKDINFEKMMKKEIDPPYKPKIKANDTTSNFDTTFTSEPVVDSVAQPSGLGTLSENPDAFAGFTYQQKSGHLTS